MKKKRMKPLEVASLQGNTGWFEKIGDDGKSWVREIVVCLAAVSNPSYYIVAAEIVAELELSVNEISVVRFLKKKVKQCHEKNQAK